MTTRSLLFPEHAVFSQVAADLAAVVAGNPHSGWAVAVHAAIANIAAIAKPRRDKKAELLHK